MRVESRGIASLSQPCLQHCVHRAGPLVSRAEVEVQAATVVRPRAQVLRSPAGLVLLLRAQGEGGGERQLLRRRRGLRNASLSQPCL